MSPINFSNTHHQYQLLFLLLLVLSHDVVSDASQSLQNSLNVSALFVFGDSSADTGNNNYIPTTFKSNFPPYGRDFIDHVPTGRFTNGKIGVDYLVSYLGLKETIPPYLDPTLSNEELQTGVNFASAGSGLDPLTAKIGDVIPVSQQVDYMEEYISRLEKVIGKANASSRIQESLAFMSVGANDFMLNYFVLPVRSMSFSVEKYQDFLLDQLSGNIQRLYDLGVRRFVVLGIAPIGCLPAQITLRAGNLQRSCVENLNLVAEQYNSKLQAMLGRMNGEKIGAKIVYGDVYSSFLDLTRDPQKFGFQETTRGCCGTGLVEIGPSCNQLIGSCPNASPYIFWDAVHPTQEVYRLLADSIFKQILQVLQ